MARGRGTRPRTINRRKRKMVAGEVAYVRRRKPGRACPGKRLAERVGFEPTEPRERLNGFRDRPIRPLWHLSAALLLYLHLAPTSNAGRGVSTFLARSACLTPRELLASLEGLVGFVGPFHHRNRLQIPSDRIRIRDPHLRSPTLRSSFASRLNKFLSPLPATHPGLHRIHPCHRRKGL